MDDKKKIFTYLDVLNYDLKIQFNHFISNIKSKKIIGKIIIWPLVEEYIQFDSTLKNTWIIEFYLNKKFWNKGIMSGIIPAVARDMQKQGINKIGAVVDKLNFGSIRILEKSGLKRIKQFDDLKDLYVSTT
ncbi:GNAT family N-acetyltransferase [Aquirufa sp. ROCK2-A2]